MEVVCKSNGDCVNGLLIDDKSCSPSTSHSTVDLNEDTGSKSDASTVYMNVEEMEDEDEQFFDVSDEIEYHPNNTSEDVNSSRPSTSGCSGIKKREEKAGPSRLLFPEQNLDDISTEAESSSDENSEKPVYTIDSDSDDSLKNCPIQMQPVDSKREIEVMEDDDLCETQSSERCTGNGETEEVSHPIVSDTVPSGKDSENDVEILDVSCKHAETEDKIEIIEPSLTERKEAETERVVPDEQSSSERERETEVQILECEPEKADEGDLTNYSTEPEQNEHETSEKENLENNDSAESATNVLESPEEKSEESRAEITNSENERREIDAEQPEEIYVENNESGRIDDTESTPNLSEDDEKSPDPSKDENLPDLSKNNENVPDLSKDDGNSPLPSKDNENAPDVLKDDENTLLPSKDDENKPAHPTDARIMNENAKSMAPDDPQSATKILNQLNSLPSTSQNRSNKEPVPNLIPESYDSEIKENSENVSVNGVVQPLPVSKNVLKELNCDPLNIKHRQEEEKKIALCSPCQVVLPLLNLDNVPDLIRSYGSDSTGSANSRKRKILQSSNEVPSSGERESKRAKPRPRSRQIEKSQERCCEVRAIPSIPLKTERNLLPFVCLRRINTQEQLLSQTKLPAQPQKTSRKPKLRSGNAKPSPNATRYSVRKRV